MVKNVRTSTKGAGPTAKQIICKNGGTHGPRGWRMANVTIDTYPLIAATNKSINQTNQKLLSCV
jgi:hypothetical protein